MPFRPKYSCPNCAALLDGTKILIQDSEDTISLDKLEPPRDDHEAAQRAARGPRFICGVGNCQLPDGFGQRDSVIIGLVGAFGSSKSHLMYAIISELTSNAGPLARLGYGFHLDQLSEPNFRTWYANTAQQHKPLAPTEVADESRSITVVATRRGAKREVNLVFVDTAGENLATNSTAAQNAAYLYATDAYLFLVPPDVFSAMPTFDAHGVPVPQDPAGPEEEIATPIADRHRRDRQTSAVLATLTSIVRQRQGARGRRAHRSPMLAVVATKADVIQRAVHADISVDVDGIEKLWQVNDYHGTNRDVYRRIMEDSSIARSMLVHLKAEGLVLSAEEISRDHAYFTVAATGGPRNANQMFIPLTPRRVLDPIVWILAQLESAKML